jgi:Family of unknown function (DUF6174)
MIGSKDRSMKRESWLWFFVPLLALTAAGIVIPIVYNLRLQLKPEQLAQARERWRQSGTQDYDLDYSARYDAEPEADEVFVKVRGGKVVRVVKNDQMLCFGDTAGLALGLTVLALPSADLSSQTVEGFFDQMESWMRHDAETIGHRNYATATFHATDGHPIRFVHRDSRTKERLEYQLKLTRAKH